MKVTTIQAQPIIVKPDLSSQTLDQGVSFDAVFQNATTILARPESNGVQHKPLPDIASMGFQISNNMSEIFKAASQTFGVPENLLIAVAKAESDFDPNCTSGAGAMGIMQLMPGTASELGVSNPYDVEENIMGGAKLLSQLLSKYDNNIPFALAAYNAGSGNVDRYGGIPPFSETQNYVKKIMGYLEDGNLTIPSTQIKTVANSTPTPTADGEYEITAKPMPYYNRQL